VRWTVDLGPRCNNRCVHCGLGELRADSSPRGDVQERLQAGRAQGADAVSFVGGEPTLHPGLIAWIDAARAAGYAQVALQTNARRLAYSSYALALAEAGLTDVEVALYGAAAAAHDEHPCLI
jgi:MoaA/NifB/PqqE/SkfB family radical SAM enzyme